MRIKVLVVKPAQIVNGLGSEVQEDSRSYRIIEKCLAAGKI